MFYEQLIAWTFNLMLIGGDIIVIVGLARSLNLRTLLITTTGLFFAGVLLAVVLGREPFMIMRLVSYALFLHLPAVLLSAAILFGRRSPKFCGLLLTLVGIIAAIGIDAFLIEPYWLSETQVRITSNKVQTPVRVAIIADLQMDKFGDYEKSAIKRSLDASPDIILSLIHI